MPTATGISTSQLPNGNTLVVFETRKKVVNKWIAFRTYISIAFNTLTQKQRSTLSSFLWKQEPSKEKFTLIGTSYSKIRNAFGEKGFEMHVFIKITRPLFGIIAPQDYLAAFGYKVVTGTDGDFSLQATPAIDHPNKHAHISDVDCSEADIFYYCMKAGYLSKQQGQALLSNLRLSMVSTMAGQTKKIQKQRIKTATAVGIQTNAIPVSQANAVSSFPVHGFNVGPAQMTAGLLGTIINNTGQPNHNLVSAVNQGAAPITDSNIASTNGAVVQNHITNNGTLGNLSINGDTEHYKVNMDTSATPAESTDGIQAESFEDIISDEYEEEITVPHNNTTAVEAYVPEKFPVVDYFLGRPVNPVPVNSAAACGNQNFVLDDEYPFNASFHSKELPAAWAFNPYMGEGHNSYDISAYNPY